MLSTEKLQRIETHLREELERLQQSSSTLEEYVEEPKLSNHPADEATDLTNQTMDLALESEKDEELAAIKKALERINNGEYGVCEVCQKEIPYERLEALPTATTCIEHTEATNNELERPTEEDVVQMDLDQPLQGAPQRSGGEDSFDKALEDGSSDTPSDL